MRRSPDLALAPTEGLPVPVNMPKYHDITVAVSNATPVWPGDVPVNIELAASMAEGSPCNVSALSLSAHAGTHVDAPFHYCQDGETTDAIALETLIGPAWVADFAGLAVIDTPHLESAGIPEDAERLLLKTDNSALWAQGGGFRQEYAHITLAAADWLIRRGVKLVGIDYLSIERYDSDGEVHRALLENGLVILETVDLSGVGQGWYELLCLPLKIAADGAPARVVLAERLG